MKILLKLVLISFLLASTWSIILGQTTDTVFPDLVNGAVPGRDPDTTWTAVAGGATATFEFHFDGSKRYRNTYSGFSSVFAFVDTSGGPGDGQGLRAYARPLTYDKVSDQYERIVEPNTADSTNIVNNFNWQTNHDDDSYSFSLALNFLFSDGVFVSVTADSSNAPFKIRFVLKKAVDRL